jgi:hypothetical protein
MLFMNSLCIPKDSDGQFSPQAKTGGADRAQTGDLLVANEALYQLSYCPGQEGSHLGQWFTGSKSLFWQTGTDRSPKGRRTGRFSGLSIGSQSAIATQPFERC